MDLEVRKKRSSRLLFHPELKAKRYMKGIERKEGGLCH